MKVKNILKRSLFIFLMFFSCLIMNTEAAAFKYSDFSFDEFMEQTGKYWLTYCNYDQKCVDKIIKSQEKFYTKLYKLLTKYEKKGVKADDAVLIATVFFGWSPDGFNDTSGSYNFDGNDEALLDLPAEYIKNETDTIKVLVNAMIGYEKVCYGVGNPSHESGENSDSGESRYTCSDGNLKIDENGEAYCEVKLSTETITAFQKFWQDTSLFGMKTRAEVNCEKLAEEKGFEKSISKVSDKLKVSEEAYWEFLTSSTYFDKKSVLTSRYLPLMKEADVEDVKELYGQEKYDEKLIEIRRNIVEDIQDILKEYKKSNPDSSAYLDSKDDKYWWPVGSYETEDIDGKTYAKGEPVSTNITASFGADASDGEVTSAHRGIDIGPLGNAGEVPIIASKNGVVVAIHDKCKSGSDKSCGSGYGNYVEIEHSDGVYTFYAHLHEGTIKVEVGDSVSQGQVIGYAGSSGEANGVYLHFEVRMGYSKENAVDPLSYVDPSNPRPKNASITFVGGGPAMQEVCKSLLASDFSKTGTAALMTNIKAESDFNPNAVGDGGTSYGLCQWHNERWTNLKNFTNKWETVEGQLDFLMHELQSDYGGLYNALRVGSGTANSLANDFCVNFERPADTITTCQDRADSYSEGMLNYVNNDCN